MGRFKLKWQIVNELNDIVQFHINILNTSNGCDSNKKYFILMNEKEIREHIDGCNRGKR